MGIVRGARRVGRLVNVFAVDVNGVGYKGGAAVSAASVALFKAQQLDLGLDPFEDAWRHFGWW